MTVDIVNIINNKLHNIRYFNYTIIFYIILIYSYYILYSYLNKKNYIILIFYFIFLLLLYKKFNKFTYLLLYVFLLVINLLDIDKFFVKNKLIENASNLGKNDESVTLGGSNSGLDEIQSRANAKGDQAKKDGKKANENAENNPCKTYITTRLEEIGIKISSDSYNIDNLKDDAQSKIEESKSQPPLDTTFVDEIQRLIQ